MAGAVLLAGGFIAIGVSNVQGDNDESANANSGSFWSPGKIASNRSSAPQATEAPGTMTSALAAFGLSSTGFTSTTNVKTADLVSTEDSELVLMPLWLLQKIFAPEGRQGHTRTLPNLDALQVKQ